MRTSLSAARAPARGSTAFLFVALAALSPLFADAPELRFRSLSAEQGLSQNTVYDVVQDRQGFIWLATQDGLHRYDGYRFTIYKPDPFDASSISHGMVQALFVDREGNLWVGTFAGLDRFDRSTHRFVHYPTTKQEVGILHRPHVTAIAQDAGGRLWVATLGDGLSCLDPESGELSVFRHRPDDPASLPDDELWAVFADSQDRLWVGTGHRGLARLIPESATFADYPPDASATGPLANTGVRSILEDRDGTLWIGTDGAGLSRLEVETGTFHAYRHDPQKPESLSHDSVWAIHEDATGELWVGTRGGGLNRLDRATGTFDHYLHDPANPHSLSHDDILSIRAAEGGTLWVGTAFGGVNIARARLKFRHVRRDPRDPGSLPHDVVRAILEDSGGSLWIGTNGGGLAVRRPGKRAFEHLSRDSRDGRALLDDNVWCLFEDSTRNLWIGTGSGLTRLGLDSGEIRHYRHDPKVASSIGPGSVRSVLVEDGGSTWVGLFGGGLSRLDPETGRAVRYRSDPADPNTLLSDIVLALLADPDGGLWVGTAGGLSHLDAHAETFVSYRSDPSDSTTLAGKMVRALHRDAGGTLWVGTEAGLNRFGRQHGVFVHFTETDGLPNNTVYAILEDARGRLWLSTNKGLSRFDPSPGIFTNFDTSDGLQGLEFNGGAAFRSDAGEMYFGGTNGYNVFHPVQVVENATVPPLVFTAFRKLNRPVALDRPIEMTDRIELRHSDRVISFEFAGLDFTEPTRNRYAYSLEGFTEGWIDLGTKHDVTFTNLDPGTYVLRVRGSNSDGVWNPDPAAITLVVRPAPWRTWWAQLLYVSLAALVLGVALWRLHRKRVVQRQVDEALRTSARRLNLALVGSGDGLWDWNLKNDEIFRARMAEMLGYRDEDLPPGRAMRQKLVHPDDLEVVEDRMQAHLGGEAPYFEAEYRMLDRSGQWRWILDRGNVVQRAEDGSPLRMAGTCKDITRQKQVEEELRLWANVFASVAEGVMITDPEGKIVAVNEAFCAMTGHEREELVGSHSSSLQSELHSRASFERIRRIIAARGRWQGEVWQHRKTEGSFLASVDVNPARDARGAITHYVAVCTDITQRKRSEEELRHLANYDTLTGLPNRTLFRDRLGHALAQARRRRQTVALLFADLDRFKQVNDSLGHATGDLVLQRAAARLQSAVREEDTVARLGGDEFAVVLEEVEDRDHVSRVADRILSAFSGTFELGDHEIGISLSIGISMFPADGEDSDTLLRQADTAMYQAKSGGRNRYAFHTEDMTVRALERLTLETQLRRALEGSQLIVHYQPMLDLASRRIIGVEALLRWQRPGRGLLSPAGFLDVAEETGLIIPIGEWLLSKACAQVVEWRREGLPPLEISVNVSTRQLTQEGFHRTVGDVLERTGLDPELLILELTEGALMESADRSISLLRSLKTHGVKIAVDDFGTGYSSLSYLKMLPIDLLKIDRSFVGDIVPGAEPAIISAIVAMAGSLGLSVVAEGVETPEQLAAVRSAGCGAAQGFLFSPPLPAAELAVLVRENAVLGVDGGARGVPEA